MAYRYRPLLTILIWGLILEILTIIYYLTAGELDRFEFHLTLILFATTTIAVVAVLRKIVREARG